MPSASAKRQSGVPSCATTTRAGLTSCSGRGQSLSAPHAARKRRKGAAANVIQQPRLVNKRGIYGGAIGYIDFTGNMDTCIAIRIAYKKNGKVFVRSGAGIVADSDPEKEFQECINKAKASLKALEVSQEVEE